MNKFRNFDSKQKMGVVITIIAAIACLYTLWPQIKPVPVAGTYITMMDMSISWITITESEKNKITCVWNDIETSDKGVIKEHTVTLEGTLNGKNLLLSATMPASGVAPATQIDAAGIREGTNIRMSLRTGGKLFYTGAYELSNLTGVVAATAQFKQKADKLAEDWNHKLALRDTGGQTENDQVKMTRNIMIQSNSYLRMMSEFVKARGTVIERFKSNTASVQDSLMNAKRIPGPQNAAVRKQLILSMQSMADLTASQQDSQAEVGKQYTTKVVPFFATLSKQQQICADTKAKGLNVPAEENLCHVATQIQQALVAQATQMQQAMNEVSASFQTEFAAQNAAIQEARHIE